MTDCQLEAEAEAAAEHGGFVARALSTPDGSPLPYASAVESVLPLVGMEAGLVARDWLILRNLDGEEEEAAWDDHKAAITRTVVRERLDACVARYLARNPDEDEAAVVAAVREAVGDTAASLMGRHDRLYDLARLADLLEKEDRPCGPATAVFTAEDLAMYRRWLDHADGGGEPSDFGKNWSLFTLGEIQEAEATLAELHDQIENAMIAAGWDVIREMLE